MGVDDRLRPYVSDLLATWGPSAAPWRELEGAFMFADVSGFTALSERLQGRGREGAELLNGVITSVLTRFVAAARRRGGDVLAFGGDAILVHVGGERSVERLALAAAEMQATLRDPVEVAGLEPVPLGVSIGIHHGTATALRLAAGDQVECVAIGRTISLTLRAEAAAEAGQVLCTHDAASQVPATWRSDRGLDGVLVTPDHDDAPPTVPDPPPPAVPLTDLVAPDVARIAGTLRAAGMHRRVAVGFVRVDRLDQLVAEEGLAAVHARIGEVFAVVAEECVRTGASILTVDSYPDAVKMMVCAGAPTATDDNEAALVEALRSSLDRLPDADVHAGAHRGLAFAGDLGAPDRRGYTVLGDTVNLAARLMQRAGAGELLASDALAHRVAVARTALPAFRVKGKAAPVQAHRVEAGDGERTVVDLPVVGRGAELDRLADAVRGALAGRTTAVEVVAPSGTGKSRLLREVVARHPELAPVVVTAAPYSASTPHSTTRGLLRQLFRIPRSLPSAEAAHWLEDLASVAPEVRDDLPLVALAIDADVPTSHDLPRDAEVLQRQVAAATLRTLRALRPDPLLLVVDDAQWTDGASQEVLRRFVMDGGDRPWLLLLATRDDAEPVLGGLPLAHQEDLAPLDREPAGELVRVAADRPLFDQDVDAIVARAQGNALFLVELARLDTEEVPDDVESLLVRRLDRLGRAAHRLVGIAAVLGNTVDRDTLEEVARGVDGTTPSVEDWRAVADLLPRLRGTLHEWREPVVREVAYAALPLRRRRTLHRAVHAVLDARPGDGSLAHEVALALHADRGELGEQAWVLLQRTGDAAAGAGASRDAVDLLTRAVHWGDRLGPDRVPTTVLVRTLARLGEAAELAGRLDVARDVLARAVTLTGSDDPASTGLRVRLGRVLTQAGDVDAAEDVLRHALGDADGPGGDVADGVRARVALAGLAHRRGDHALAVALAREVETHAEAAPPEILARARLLGDAASIHTGDPDWDPGRGRRLFEDLHDDVGLAHTDNNLGLRAYYRGAWPEAVEHWTRASAAARRAGDLVTEATMRNNVAEVTSDRGGWEAALEAFLQVARTWEAAGYAVGRALATANAGRALARLGRSPEAAAELEQAEARFREIGTTDLALDVALRRAEAAWLAAVPTQALAVLAAAEPELASQPSWMRITWLRLRGAVCGADGLDDLATAHHEASAASLPFERLQCAALLVARGRDELVEEVEALARGLGVARLATPDGPQPLAS